MTGTIHTGDGMGWHCPICAALQCSPGDLTDRPALAIVSGMGVCTVHAVPAMKVAPPFNRAPERWVAEVVDMVRLLELVDTNGAVR